MKSAIAKLSYVSVLATTFIQPTFASKIDDGAGDAKGELSGATLGNLFGTISNVLIYLVGAIAVIMLIIGGLRYVISQGDSSAVKQAKDTILYAVIGIVVAILAYAIVHFVAGSIK